jgi:serine/threonine protein kinase
MGMHPNVATCYYVLNLDEIPHLFIEYVDGGNLKDWLTAGRCKDLRTALSMAIQFCHGMEFTHAQGIIHRDIKPQNILLTKNALIKITDFGIIQNTTSPEHSKTKLKGATTSQTVGFRGTPGYASPEQFKDSHLIDKRTDIFSFGICLWLMLCSKKPYKSNEVEEELDPTPAYRGAVAFPASLGNLLKKIVNFDVEKRHQSFTSLRHDLNAVYLELFDAGCPYMDLDFTDLQAENYNNRAVSLLELGKTKEGSLLLVKALNINDTLPETVYNYTLLKWKYGKTPTDYIFRQLQAAKQRLPESKLIDALITSVKCDILGNTWDNDEQDTDEDSATDDRKKFYPEFALCMPKNSVDVFRSSQIYKATRLNVTDLLEKKNYETCLDVLNKGWEKIYYRADSSFIKAYETLLPLSKKKSIRSAIRIKTIPGKGASAGAIMHLPGTKKILTLDKSGKVIIRSFPKKTTKISVLGKHHSVVCTAISPDGSMIALGKKEGTVDILSFKTGEIEKSFTANGKIQAVAFNPDNTSITFGSSTGTLQTNSLVTGRQQSAVNEGIGPITAVTYFDQHDDFVSGGADGKIRFWAAGGKECIHIAEAHALPVTTLSPADNGRIFLSAAADRNVKVWDRQTGQCMKSIEAHDDAISAALMLPESKYFISGSDDDILKIWDLEQGKCRLTLDGRGDGITSLAPGSSPHLFLSGRQDGAVVIWMVIYDLELA